MPEVISARDNPGTLREFETVLILRPDTLQEGILELNNKIKELIDQDEGRMLLVENWGKRRLAYEIRKQLKGIYMYFQFLGHSQLIKEMERNFRLSESVIRYFTTRIDENIDPTARPGELSDEDFLAASATRPDEEELATGYVMTGTGEKIPVSRLGYQKTGDAEAAEKPAAEGEKPAAEGEKPAAEGEKPAAEVKADAAPAAEAPAAEPTPEAKTEAEAEKPAAEAEKPTAKAKADTTPAAEAPAEEPAPEAKTEAEAPAPTDDKEEA